MYYSFSEGYASHANELKTKAFLFADLPDSNLIAVTAIWDTGANRSVITGDIRMRLNLVPIASRIVFGVNSKQAVGVVATSIKLPNVGGKTNFSFVIPSLPVSYNLAEEADKLNSNNILN